MATDYQALSVNLCRFYDFTGKVVLFVGAAGGQLLDPATPTRKLVAIDKNAAALEQLHAAVAAKGLQATVEVVAARFEEVVRTGDVVYFEFCLHEMDDPETSLRHARSLAPDIVVYDHSPESEWIYYGAEEDKVAQSAAALARFGVRRRETFLADQRFATHADLLAKVGPQGPVAVSRAQRFIGCTDIVIPMRYEVNLL